MLEKVQLDQLKQMSQGLSILIVEDEVELAQHYEKMARFFYSDVTVVNSALDALEANEKKVFDIIYTDINMPKMNGVELIRTLKARIPKQHFIVISASNDSKNLLNLLQLGISAFILKPFQVDEFVAVSTEKIALILHEKSLQEANQNISMKLQETIKEKETQEDILIKQTKLAQTGEMISMIAHQWRQPLSSITTQIATLRTRIDLGLYDETPNPMQALTNELNTAFEKIENSALFLSNTINNFRDFYRPSDEKVLFHLQETITSIVEMLMLGQQSIEIHYEPLAVATIELTGNKGELQQVLMSIINNARDALVEKKVKQPRITIELESNEKSARVTIADNAGGIPNEIIERIFLPYFTTKSKKEGTGIGLYMAKTIIEKHMQGVIHVENSTLYGGACFIIEIPLLKELS